MNKKLPGIFVNKIEKKINNNKTVYNSTKEEKPSTEPVNIQKKIQKLFQTPNYIYKVDTKITLKDKVITKRVIGYNEKNIITFDNELIPVENILDIEIEK